MTRRPVVRFATAVLVLAACSEPGDAEPDGPRSVVFGSERRCAELTGVDTCDVVLCDFVPEGRTLAETCGPYFQEGLTAGGLSDADIEDVLRRAGGCVPVGEIDDRRLRVGSPAGDDWFTISGPAAWLEEARDHFVAACDGS